MNRQTQVAMFCMTLLTVMVMTQSGRSEREAQIPVHSPSISKIIVHSIVHSVIDGDTYMVMVKKKKDTVTAYISCGSAPLDTPPAPLPGRWGEVSDVTLIGCSPPAPPDPPALALALAARGARPRSIMHMELRDVPPEAKFNASHFKGLESLGNLSVQAAGEGSPEQLDSNFLQSLPKLDELSLENEALPPFTNTSNVRVLHLARGRSLGKWGDCKALGLLDLRDWRLPMGLGPADGWLAECKFLGLLQAERIERNSLQSLLSGLDTLPKLVLPNNALTQPDLLAALRNMNELTVLSVQKNNLTNIDKVLESSHTKLRKLLDLSRNLIDDFVRTWFAVFRSENVQYSLHRFILNHNPLREFCTWNQNRWVVSTGGRALPRVKMVLLSLVGTNISRVCFADWNIRRLNLSNNNFTELQFGQLPMNAAHTIVDLRYNPLREVHFNKSNYNALTLTDTHRMKKRSIKVYTDQLPPFDCNCNNAWLARALRERLVQLPAGALCQGGEELLSIPPSILECDLQYACKLCICQKSWETSTVIMRCDEVSLRKIPSISNLNELHIMGTRLDTIRVEDLPETLTLVNISYNKVSRVDKAAVAHLFEVLNRRVWLAGNPIACDCDNWPLLNALQAHHVQVEDYKNVTCADGRLLDNVTQEQLCSTTGVPDVGLVWIGAGGSIAVGLLVFLGALYLRYEQQLKIWLFTRGWCLSCVSEEELDADREYDAFLSFAHGDHEFVASQLLPGLEDGPHGYKVCVHYRDWMPGDLIPTQIIRSVLSSRRTVIVLSANFVQSMWGIMEFRAAYMSALEEGRVRLLVVALEDAPPPEELPEELRLYMRSTTYLSWEDPWFWEKLRYALPHRTARRVKQTEPGVRPVINLPPVSPANIFEMVLYQ